MSSPSSEEGTTQSVAPPIDSNEPEAKKEDGPRTLEEDSEGLLTSLGLKPGKYYAGDGHTWISLLLTNSGTHELAFHCDVDSTKGQLSLGVGCRIRGSLTRNGDRYTFAGTGDNPADFAWLWWRRHNAGWRTVSPSRVKLVFHRDGDKDPTPHAIVIDSCHLSYDFEYLPPLRYNGPVSDANWIHHRGSEPCDYGNVTWLGLPRK